MSLRARLRAATALQHERIEQTLRITADDATLDEYVDYIERTWQYYAAVEPRLGAIAASDTFGLNHGERSRLPWLADDLRHFGMPPSHVRLRLPLDASSTPAAALGCRYVLEGSALGGRVLYAALRRRWGVERGRGATFLYGDGEHTGQVWKSFVAALDAVSLSREEESACIETARATFETLEACYASVTHAPRASAYRAVAS